MPRLKRTGSLISCLVAIFATSSMHPSSALAQQPPIWESNFGTGLNLRDDSSVNAIFGTLSFPYAGTVYTGSDILDVSSNGFVSLGGSNGNDCCNGDTVDFLLDPFPRLSPLWGDIDPANAPSDNVFINSFNDDADAAVDRTVVTWDAQHWGSGQDVLFQLQLLESGVIVFGYNGISPLDRNTLIGIGTGGGAADPGASDLSTGPFIAGNNNIYEFLPIGSNAGILDLDNSNVVFTPIPVIGGFVVSQLQAAAVPEPSSLAAIAMSFVAVVARRRR